MKNNKGFSLVELIVVIAIMAILASIAVVSFSVYIDKAHQAADEEYYSNVFYRVELFRQEHQLPWNPGSEVIISPIVDAEAKDGIWVKIVMDDGTEKWFYGESLAEIYEFAGSYESYGAEDKEFERPVPPEGTNPPQPGDGGGGGENACKHADYDTVEVEGTCVSQGYIEYTCKAGCGYSYRTYTGFADHKTDNKLHAIGTFSYYYCDSCNNVIVQNGSGEVVTID